MTDNVKLAAIDGTDALAFVIIRPGSTEGGVSIEAAANGMGKDQAAYVLRHVADQFDADTPSGQSSVDPKAVLAVLATLAERWEQLAASHSQGHPTDFYVDMTPFEREESGKAHSYRKAAADLREVLASGRIPHDLMTDTELGG